MSNFFDLEPDAPAESPEAPILVVDDDASTLFAVREVLAALGQPVICVNSGTGALRQLLEREVALILLDVSMPEMDGYETAEMIRARPRTRHVPIIFLSAVNKDSSHLFRGYSAGAVDYVFKPVSPEILRSKVTVFIELHSKIQEVRRQAELEKRLLAENLEVRRKQSETVEALQRSEKQQSLIIQSLPLALYVAFPDDGFQSREFVGGMTQKLCGFAPTDFSRKRKAWLSRIHDGDRQMVVDALEQAGETGSFYAEYRWRCGDESYRWFSDRGIISPSKKGEAELFGLWLDISERRALEQQLAHSQKMDALGRMTGGIAHDFNNMLSVILGSLQLLEKSETEDPKARRRVELALQAARTCTEMTKRLLGFARQQTLEPVILAVDEEIERLKDLLAQTLKSHIDLKIDCPKGVGSVYIDRTQLESALVNLAINARDAMPDGGTFTISAANRRIDGVSASELEIEPGRYIELAVADTGTGMPEEVIERAFEPFFTTKSLNKGTGLGLSTIHGFLKQSGGAVRIESEIGEGTVVRLYLPRSRSHISAEKPNLLAKTGSDPMSLDGITVLVVEDEACVREIAISMLEDLGCTAIEAADGAEALRYLKERPAISLLFTDCAMPGELDGPRLAEEARHRKPEMPVLLTSAFPEHRYRDPRFGFLPKPYSSSDLHIAVCRLMKDA